MTMQMEMRTTQTNGCARVDRLRERGGGGTEAPTDCGCTCDKDDEHDVSNEARVQKYRPKPDTKATKGSTRNSASIEVHMLVDVATRECMRARARVCVSG